MSEYVTSNKQPPIVWQVKNNQQICNEQRATSEFVMSNKQIFQQVVSDFATSNEQRNNFNE